jgi:hypothetical protein
MRAHAPWARVHSGGGVSAGDSLVVDRVAGGPDGLLAAGDSPPGAGRLAICSATGMDAMANLDRSLGRPYDLGAGKEHRRAIHRLLIRSVLYESTA